MAEKTGRGGKRAGAGRPEGTKEPQTLEKALMRARLREMVNAAFTPLVEAQIANAQGIKYLVARDKSGKFNRISEEELKAILDGQDSDRVVIEVWDKDPSVQAFSDLMNRAIDKPIEPVEVEHSGGISVTWEE